MLPIMEATRVILKGRDQTFQHSSVYFMPCFKSFIGVSYF